MSKECRQIFTMGYAFTALDVLQLGVPHPANPPGVRLTHWALREAIVDTAFNCDASHAAFATAGGSVRLVATRQFDGRKMVTAQVHDGPIKRLRRDAAGNGFLTTGADGRAVMLDVDGYMEDLYDSAGNEVCLSITSRGGAATMRAVGHDDRLTIVDRDGRVQPTLSTGGGLLSDVAVSPNGRMIAAMHTRGLTIWPLDQLRSRGCDHSATDPIGDLCWSPGSRRLASIGNGEVVRCWHIDDRGNLNGGLISGTACSLSWSWQGRHLVGSGEDGLLCWFGANTRRGDKCRPARLGVRSGCTATQASCHPRHNLAAVGFADGCLMLVDFINAREILIAHSCGSPITAMAWSPDGEFLGAGTRDGSAMMFNFTRLTRQQSGS